MIAVILTGRVIAVDDHFIPSSQSKPFVVAFFHGKGKPEEEAFLFDLIEELNFLHPCSESEHQETYGVARSIERTVIVRVRALILDAQARFWLKGTKPSSGYFACERCLVRYDH